MHVVAPSKLALNQILDQCSVPAAGVVAGCCWSSIDQLTQALLLSRSQLGWSSRRSAWAQAGPALQHKGMQPVVDRLGADAQPLRDQLDRPVVAEHQQGANTLNCRSITALKGDAQEMFELLDSRATQMYFSLH